MVARSCLAASIWAAPGWLVNVGAPASQDRVVVVGQRVVQDAHAGDDYKIAQGDRGEDHAIAGCDTATVSYPRGNGET
jgi:hypothetical protein